MKKNYELAFSLAAIWVPSAAAVIAGLYFTRRPICLVGMLIPALMKISTNNKPINKE